MSSGWWLVQHLLFFPMRNDARLREDVLAIWLAGLKGVMPERLIRDNVFLERERPGGPFTLHFQEHPYPLEKTRRIVLIGAGKASGAMAESLERLLEPALKNVTLEGFINVPDDCVKKLPHVKLHGARPPGKNEPCEAGLQGCMEMLKLVRTLGKDDLCIALFSGGGSALLPMPVPEITLDEKIELTRLLAATGADIAEINTVRKQCSLIKGGGLLEFIHDRNLVSLIISDVPGNSLDLIASGPTVPNTTGPLEALEVLRKYELEKSIPNISEYLKRKISRPEKFGTESGKVLNLIIGSNAIAVDEAGIEAEKRGYSHAMISSPRCEGNVADLALEFVDMAMEMREGGPDCFISGGEPVVKLAPPEIRGKGGRNQQLTLEVLHLLKNRPEFKNGAAPELSFLSGGTDGEDGTSDAAGAMFDATIFNSIPPEFDIEDYLNRNDAYSFFDEFGGLLKTGPSGTNVCDLRVMVMGREAR